MKEGRRGQEKRTEWLVFESSTWWSKRLNGGEAVVGLSTIDLRPRVKPGIVKVDLVIVV